MTPGGGTIHPAMGDNARHGLRLAFLLKPIGLTVRFAFPRWAGGSMIEFHRAERLSIRAHPHLSEKWVQELIATDPSILGLGDLELRQKERAQHHAGRLDLLLQDLDTKR